MTTEMRARVDAARERLQRADDAIRKARKKSDAAALAKAETKSNAAKREIEALVNELGLAAGRDVPRRIRYTSRTPWSGSAGASGIHVQEVEMVLDYLSISGPEWRTVAVLRDVDGPPQNAREAPSAMGASWDHVGSMLKSGMMVEINSGNGDER